MPKDDGQIIGKTIRPEEIVKKAKAKGCKTIAYTYTEPTIFFEYALDTAIRAHEKGIYNVFVTNGYMTSEALETLRPYLDAANVDLKAYTDDFYRKICGARLQPVLDSIRKMKEMGTWVEITTLIIPGLNDEEEQLRGIANFIGEVGIEIPWHISAFFPTYKMRDLSPTPLHILHRAREIGKEAGLRYVYSGNVPGDEGENTFCYTCKKILINRIGYRILKEEIRDSRCPSCEALIDGVGF